MTPFFGNTPFLKFRRDAIFFLAIIGQITYRLSIMTTTNTQLWWTYGAPFAGGALRGVIATPLDNIATREILQAQTTWQIVKEMSLSDWKIIKTINRSNWQTIKNMRHFEYGKGLQPNVLKFTTRTPLSFFYVKLSSSAVPTHLDPAIRGVLLGVFTGGLEAASFNGFNAIRTRFIQGERWRTVLKKEGVVVLLKGLSPAFAHRAMSWAVFMGVYEKLKSRYPDPKYHVAVSTTSGFFQVVCTAPFYITAIRKQDKAASPLRLDKLIIQLYKTRGLARGLFLPAIAPRLVHSAITSAPLTWLMEKINLIHRKG
jgi:hypothetical protein